MVVSNLCHWFEPSVLLYSTVKVVPGGDSTSKLKAPGLHVAFVRVIEPFPEAVVKLPPVYPLSRVPEGFWPFATVQRINRPAGRAAVGVQVSTVLPALHEEDSGRPWYVAPSKRNGNVRLVFMASLKVITSAAEVGTPLAPLVGSVETMTG